MKMMLAVVVIACVIFYFFTSSQNQKAAKKNIELGNAFLAENKLKEGVTTTASGLQYQVLTAGDGTVHPKASDTVTVHYHGTLIDGTVFDSSVERGEPIAFPLNRVIKGWTEGVQLMVVGEKTRFFIPSTLAYGNRSAGKITAGSTLIFDVELINID
ncbi:FKBP-type peptidyl-prolyl cis-trans isomerase [Shewanella sp.]|nr:FKBP-type peptidyl-prolyl cis-trans isomerase [Shewanella sp.]